MTFGIDYAWGLPSISALRNAGAGFVCRYLSHDTSKNLSHGEAMSLTDAGIWIVVVWEDTASRALDGHAAGATDAATAHAQAQACGMPAGRPIYFAVDFDMPGSQAGAVTSYLDGAGSVLGAGRVGIYGGYAAVHAAMNGGHAAFGWQTYAWSGGAWDSRAQLRQYSNDHTLDGVGVDYNTAQAADYGQWKVGSTPGGGGGGQPTTVEDDVPYGLLNAGVKAITPISLPLGRYKTIGFIADNGLQGLPPAALRVAIHTTKGWQVEQATVDSTKGQAVITFPDAANTDGLSVQRTDGGVVTVAWEVS